VKERSELLKLFAFFGYYAIFIVNTNIKKTKKMNKNELNFAALGVCQPHSSIPYTVGTQSNEFVFNRISPTTAGTINIGAISPATTYNPVSGVNCITLGSTLNQISGYTSVNPAFTNASKHLVINTGATIGWNTPVVGISNLAASTSFNITGGTVTENLMFKTSEYGFGVSADSVTMPITAGVGYYGSSIIKDYTSISSLVPSNSIAFPASSGITASILGTKPQNSFNIGSSIGVGNIISNTGTGSVFLTQPTNIFSGTNVEAFNSPFITGSQTSVLGWFNNAKENFYSVLTQSATTIKSTIAPVFTAGKELVSLMNQLKDNVNIDHFGFNYDTEYSGGNVTINFHFHLTVNSISGTYAHIGNNIYNQKK
jgi:hypothetical protein